jgi:hypothetical protein
MTDLTIVIPHRGDTIGLWATLHSCEEELRHSKLLANYVVVTNGGPIEAADKECLHHLGSKLKAHIHFDEPVTPPTARQRGSEAADGRILAFFDNHCLAGRQYFDRAVLDFDKHGVDCLHSTTVFYVGSGHQYHYKLKLAYNFWGENATFPESEYKPYSVAAAGHGGFLVRKDVWDAVGGYGPENILVGYGGEEMIFDLKLWRYGYNVSLDPKLVHYHYPGRRPYSRHYTDEYYTNLMASANVIGGQKWLDTVFHSFSTKPHIRLNAQKEMFDLMLLAHERSAQYAVEVELRSKYSLDELLQRFAAEQVAM